MCGSRRGAGPPLSPSRARPAPGTPLWPPRGHPIWEAGGSGEVGWPIFRFIPLWGCSEVVETGCGGVLEAARFPWSLLGMPATLRPCQGGFKFGQESPERFKITLLQAAGEFDQVLVGGLTSRRVSLPKERDFRTDPAPARPRVI